jgi:cob(I)alamin adenosyltransferase
MTLEELADLIRANSANTNGRIDRVDARLDLMRNETNAALMNLQNDMTDLRSDVADIRKTLDMTSALSALQKQIDTLAAEVAELKRKAS